MDFASGLTELNTLIGDGDNFIFTPDQKNQFLTTAWNDSWVSVPVWDNSLTYASGTFQYLVPPTVSALADVYIQRSSTDYPEPIDNGLWEVLNVAGVPTLQFVRAAAAVLPSTYPLFLKGRYKLTTNDTLPNVELENYVMSNAGYLSLRNLGYQKVVKFLRNETSLADILNLRKDLLGDVTMWRTQLQRQFESA